MTSKSKHNFTQAYAIMITVLLLVLMVACAPQAAPKPAADSTAPQPDVELSVVLLYDVTGPSGAGTTVEVKGANAMCDWLNATKYVPGIKLKWRVLDTAGDAAKSLAAYKQVVGEAKPPVCLQAQTGSGSVVADSVNKDKIPMFMSGTPPSLVTRPPGYIFFYNPYFPDMTGAYIDWFMKNWKKPTPPTFAWLTWDIPTGRVVISPEIEAYIKDKGIKIVPGEYVPAAPSDTSSNLARLKAAGVDFTYGGMQAEPAAVIYKDLAKMGMVGTMQLGWAYFAGLDQVITYTGATAVEGSVETTPLATQADFQKSPLAALYKPEMNLSASQQPYFILGAKRAGIVAEGIRLAAASVGPQKVDKDAVYQALQTIKDFDPWGISPPVTFSATNRIASRIVWIEQAKDGKLIYADKGIVAPDLVPGGKDVPK